MALYILCLFVLSIFGTTLSKPQNPIWSNFDQSQNPRQQQRQPQQQQPRQPQQQQPWWTNDGNANTMFPIPGSNQIGDDSSSVGPSTTTTTTTPSPRYLACLQACPYTSEYNPVCGSDQISYHNNGRLRCAVRCGQNVVATRMGTCDPL